MASLFTIGQSKMDVLTFVTWFQPLTGSTAEKHDGFIDLKNGQAVEKFSAGELSQGRARRI